MSRLGGLLASLAALFSLGADGNGTPTRRLRPSVSAIDKAHQRAADRKRALDRLSALEGYGYILTPEMAADLRYLRLTRGKLARRMGRQRKRSINRRLRAAAERRVARGVRRRRERAS